MHAILGKFKNYMRMIMIMIMLDGHAKETCGCYQAWRQ